MEHVFISRKLPGPALDRLKEVCDIEVWPGEAPIPPVLLSERLAHASGYLSVLTDPVSASLMDSAPGLRVISNYAVGFDNIDVAAATARGIPVGHTPDVLTETTADLAFSLLMSAARRIVEGAAYSRTGRFTAWSPTMLLGRDVHGTTLGVVGMGRIGRAVARRAAGFDMRVLFTQGSTPLPDVVDGARKTDLDTLLSESDFVSLHLPLTERTRGLIGAAAFKRMKPEAILINTARGPVVDQDALVAALKEGEIAGAALDVTTPEPLPTDHPLFALERCLIVPHLGSATQRTRERMTEMAVSNLLAGLRGAPLPHCVNPEVYEK